MPTVEITKDAKNIVDWLVDTEIEPSKRQAREDVSGGAISINGDRVTDLDFAVDPTQHFDGKFVVVRKGRKITFSKSNGLEIDNNFTKRRRVII